MKSILSKLLAASLMVALTTADVRAFSLIGPYSEWQVQGIGYQLPGDIGGPMNLSEGFRWNVPLVTYAFDQSFIDYFGPDGVAAIDQAFQHFNDLEASSKVSSDLSDYSPSSLRQNFEAAELGLLDLKSTAMSLIIEQLGLADPIRFTYTLRARSVTGMNPMVTNYTTVLRNFDPVTLGASRYVNGTLYTFDNLEPLSPPINYADAVESVVGDPVEALASVPVATGVPLAGNFFVGLTRDDVGGLRYLMHPNNYAVEPLLPTVTLGAGRANAYLPYLGTNATTITNVTSTTATNFVSTGLRGGRNHLTFKRVRFDSLLGSGFRPVTNSYTDVVTTNSSAIVQKVARAILAPDIVFVAEDIGVVANLVPALTSRSGTGGWIDNDAINGADEVNQSSGPGVIAPPIRISFSNQLPYFSTDTGTTDAPGESTALLSAIWGSFDGTTNAPIIYPFNGLLSVGQLRQRLLNRTTVPE